jgi:hypothetical protein
MSGEDDGVPEAEDLRVSYEPPTVFDAGKVVVVTHGNASGVGDSSGQSFS